MTPAIDPFPGPEERLCLLLSYVDLGAAEIDQAQRLAERVRCWERVWALAAENGIAPHVARAAAGADVAARMPAGVRARFEHARAEVVRDNRTRLEQADVVLAKLIAAQVPIAVVKGAHLAVTVYRDVGYKRMNDLDLFIRREDLDTVQAIYREAGFTQVGGARHAGPKERLTAHGLPYRSADGRCLIDTQWAFASPLRRYTIDYATVWSRVEPLTLGSVTVNALSPEDALHHLCVHLDEFRIHLRELSDLFNLVRRHGSSFRWERFLDDVGRARTTGAVFHALALANRLCPRVEVEETVARLRRHAPRHHRRAAACRTRDAGALMRLGTDHVEVLQDDFATLMLGGTLEERGRACLRLWRDLLAPPRQVALKLRGRVAAGRLGVLAARALAPATLLGVFRRSIGIRWVLLLLLASLLHPIAGPVQRARRRSGGGAG